MFCFVIRTLLLVAGIVGNTKHVLPKLELNYINASPGGKFRFYEQIANGMSIFALTLGYGKNLYVICWFHSFFMTVSNCLQFGHLVLYWTYKHLFPQYHRGVDTGDKKINLFIEYSQHMGLFVASMFETMIVCRAKKTITLLLVMLGFGYVSFVCYLKTLHNFWVYKFMDEFDNVKIAVFFGVVTLLPMIYYRVLLSMMPKIKGEKEKKK